MEKKWLSKIIFAIGFVCCIYPIVSSIIMGYYQKNAVITYSNSITSSDIAELEEDYKKAQEYNEYLLKFNTGISIDTTSLNIMSEESYNKILNIGNGIMGSIEIPKINVNLPIYHGTSDEVLSTGVGHVMGSSFPVGGIGTRSILTGHRGLPNAKLFTRLDEIENGDLFFIRIQDKTLAYKVNDIQVIEPEQVDVINVVEGKDLVSLVTCTPYGINTHRLVVTGERTEYVQEEYENIESKNISIREGVFLAIPFIFLTIVVGRRISLARKKA